MNEFGGLEEFAKNLAVGTQKQGHPVSFLSTVWVPPDNQYKRDLVAAGVEFLQPQRWLSNLISDWETKQKILSTVMFLSAPVVWVLALALMVVKGKNWKQAKTSARGWLQGLWMKRIIGPDRRKPVIIGMLNRWVKQWQPDVIHIQGYTSDLLYLIDWAHEKGIPVIYEEHQTPDAQFDWWKDFRQTINKASMVIGVSEKSGEALRDVAGVREDLIRVAYYMVPDPQEAGWSPESVKPREDGVIRITTPVRLYVTKGLNYLLEAIVKVKAVYPKAQFRVYGDGPMRDELLAYAEKLGLNGKEIFVGPFTSREHLSRIMSETDIFTMSSILEGLPVALLEAMSYGRPLVVTPVGGIPEAIQDGENGLLCPARDPHCLAQKLICMIENAELRERLGRAARKSYETGPYHPLAVVNNFISIYEEVVDNRKRKHAL
jgi:glycosyltransferase involved in cell wall biosynthesis